MRNKKSLNKIQQCLQIKNLLAKRRASTKSKNSHAATAAATAAAVATPAATAAAAATLVLRSTSYP